HWLCPRPVVACCAAPAVSYGCYGCYGFAGPSSTFGYGSSAYYGYAAPSAPAYTPAAPAMGVYGVARPSVPPPATSVTVTTPRLSLALNLGSRGIIIGRPALATGRLAGPTARPTEAPPSESL